MGDPELFETFSGDVFVDGSGLDGAMPEFRRCGMGAVMVNGLGHLRVGMYAAFPVWSQAEQMAVQREMDRNSSAEYITALKLQLEAQERQKLRGVKRRTRRTHARKHIVQARALLEPETCRCRVQLGCPG